MLSIKNDKLSFFEGYESPLSTLRFANFELDGRKFNSAEQCFQLYKAEYFGDFELARRIMDEGVSPLECRHLGDTLDSARVSDNWPNYALKLMERANVSKFMQNVGLRKYLFMTHDSHLVYCNPEEQFWSIGLGKANPKIKDVNSWKGPNHLGEILVEIRNTLMDDPDFQKELESIERDRQVNKRKYQAKLEKAAAAMAKKAKDSP